MLVIAAVVCGAIYMVVSPKPTIKRTASEPPTRTLAYQQQISRSGAGDQGAGEEGEAQKHAIMSADSAPAKPAQAEGAPAPSESAAAGQPQAAAPAKPKTAAPAQPTQLQSPVPQQEQPSDMAGLPPDDEAEPYDDPNALSWQHGGRPPSPAQPGYPAQPGMGYPAEPGMGAEAPGQPGAWPEEEGYQDYRQDAEAWPGEDADPNAWPAAPQEEPKEWVQVLVSGAGMHGVASEDAPMLFAFPYGRTLRVISRYGNWVEVTDPQSATTGWMKAQYLAPIAAPRRPQEVEAWYDEPPRRRRGWFRRNGVDGFADMINRALTGGF